VDESESIGVVEAVGLADLEHGEVVLNRMWLIRWMSVMVFETVRMTDSYSIRPGIPNRPTGEMRDYPSSCPTLCLELSGWSNRVVSVKVIEIVRLA